MSSLHNKHIHLTHPKYRADIDGLRAIAILAVVAFHAFPYWMKGGFIGVDVFFVISGFLISTIIFGSLEHNRFSFLEFYSKRIRRIFPALLLVLFCSYLLGWALLFPHEYKQLGLHISGGAGFFSNFLLWNETGYFDELADTKPMLHLWSLAIEEQFYIVWPLLLAFVWKRHWGFIAITVAVAGLSFAANIYWIGKHPPSSFYLPVARFWELMIGCGLAYLSLHKPHLLGGYRNAQSILGFALLAVGLLLLNKAQLFPGWCALLPTLGAFFIISAGQHAWLNRHVLSNKLMVWFGLISYPLYLWHWPILSFIRIVEGQLPLHDRAIRIGAVFAAILLAWLTYRFTEKPFRTGRHGNAKAIILVVLMATAGLTGYFTYRLNGLEFRVRKTVEVIPTHMALADLAPKNEVCSQRFPQFKTFTACSISRPGDPTIAVVGDSHSLRYYYHLKQAFPQETVINIAHFKCLPFSSKTHQSIEGCQDKFNTAVAFLKNQQSIKTVYLAGYWNYLAAGGFGVVEAGWKQPRPLTPEESLSFRKNGEYLISRLISSNKKIIFLRDNPDLTFSIQSCLYEMPLRFHSNETKVGGQCAMEKSGYEKRIVDYETVINQILAKFPEVRVFDPRQVFCDNQLCWGIRDGHVLYDDGDHVSAFAAGLVLKDLLSQLSAQQQSLQPSHLRQFAH